MLLTAVVKKTILLALLILIWGASWSVNKMALDYTPPLIYAAIRGILGGLFLSVFILHSWKKIQWRQHWQKYLISSFVNVTCFFGIQTIGLIYLPGGLFSVLVYFQPVLVGIFAWLWLGEEMSWKKFIGFILGFFGIFVISAEGITGSISIIGVLLALLTALSWALGVIYVKKVGTEVDGMWMVVFQSFLGGGMLLVFGSFFESWSQVEWTLPYVGAVLFGSTLGIPVAYVIYYHLIYSGEASKVAAFTFLVPVVSVIISSIFLKESLTLSLLVGLFLIAISISLVNSKRTAKKIEEREYMKQSV